MTRPRWHGDGDDPTECHSCGRQVVLEQSFDGQGRGLCALRDPHPPHDHHSRTLGRFWCTGDPLDREPERSRRRWRT